MQLYKHSEFPETLMILMKLYRQHKGASSHKLLKEALQRQVKHLFQVTFKINFQLSAQNPLSFMELVCLGLFLVGKQQKQVAHLLDLSEDSIDMYERRIRKKLQVINRQEALYVALSQRFLSIGFDAMHVS